MALITVVSYNQIIWVFNQNLEWQILDTGHYYMDIQDTFESVMNSDHNIMLKAPIKGNSIFIGLFKVMTKL